MFLFLIAKYARVSTIAVIAFIVAYIGGKKVKESTFGILIKKSIATTNGMATESIQTQILYLPIRILLWCSKQIFGVDLYGRERQGFEGLYDMSYLMYKYTGYHFMYWPKPIRERCFVCVRLKTSAVEWKANQVDKAFTKGLPKEMKKGESSIMQAVEYIKTAFSGNMKVKKLSKGNPDGSGPVNE